MKIYTKKGDNGLTHTLSGKVLPKSDSLICAIGEIDELNAHLSIVASFFYEPISSFILSIQEQLFIIGSHLAADKPEIKIKLPKLDEQKIIHLEKEIDAIEEKIPRMTHFVLPGKNFEVGMIHIARTVCRRAERTIVRTSKDYEIDNYIVQYLNRLSDYLFVLSRYKNLLLGIEEIKWIS